MLFLSSIAPYGTSKVGSGTGGAQEGVLWSVELEVG